MVPHRAAAVQVSQLSPAGVPARIASERAAPALVDLYCDRDLAQLASFADVHGHPTVLWRPLADGERAALEGRAAVLRAGLAPFSPEVEHLVDAAIGGMLGGFRTMRQAGEDAVAVVEVTRAVLGDLPLWAIERGCMSIARGQAGLDRRFAPNDAEIYSVVVGIVGPYRRRLAMIEALLVADVEPPQSRASSVAPRVVTPADARFTLPGDGNHAERVAADLAARKAARETGASEAA